MTTINTFKLPSQLKKYKNEKESENKKDTLSSNKKSIQNSTKISDLVKLSTTNSSAFEDFVKEQEGNNKPIFKIIGETLNIAVSDVIKVLLDEKDKDKNKESKNNTEKKEETWNNDGIECKAERIITKDENGNKISENLKCYDKDGKIAEESTWNFDENGRMTSHTLERISGNGVKGKWEVDINYDENGNRTDTGKRYDENGNLDLEYTKIFDKDYNLISNIGNHIGENGKVTGRTETEFKYDENGNLEEESTWNYYENGKMSSWIFERHSGNGMKGKWIVDISYDENGNRIDTGKRYDESGKIDLKYTKIYDKDGNLISNKSEYVK